MGFTGCLKVDNFSSEQMCMGREFQADCIEAEKTLGEKVLVMPTDQIPLLQPKVVWTIPFNALTLLPRD